jgi:hypothetical protein
MRCRDARLGPALGGRRQTSERKVKMAYVVRDLESFHAGVCELMLADEITELQKTLSGVDRHQGRRGGPWLTFSIAKMGNVKIKMGADKTHQRPHVHVSCSKDRAAVYSIDSGECLAGELPSREDRVVREWILIHRSHVRYIWELTQAGKSASALIHELRNSG